jgi:hypothetical protein
VASRKQTSGRVATEASDILQRKGEGKEEKSVAGSDLSQAGVNRKQTSQRVATEASHVLRGKGEGKEEKSVAASDLAQARGKPKKGR